MNNRFIFIPGVFVLGMLAGIAIIKNRAPDDPGDTSIVAETAPAPDPEAVANPFASVQTSPGIDDRLQALQSQYDRLSERLDRLEKRVATATDELESAEETTVPAPPANSSQAGAATLHVPTVDSLVKAGIGRERAEDIMRRTNEIELKKLELRDRAIREHYLGTGRYNRELSELAAGDVNLREELGDDAYDRYLYATRQNNRVRVTSVMVGSQAESAGIQSGDIILSYDDRNLFDWSELQQATTLGERGEYVSMDVLRDGQLLNLWVPRGPLGIRLGATRLDPQAASAAGR